MTGIERGAWKRLYCEDGVTHVRNCRVYLER